VRPVHLVARLHGVHGFGFGFALATHSPAKASVIGHRRSCAGHLVMVRFGRRRWLLLWPHLRPDCSEEKSRQAERRKFRARVQGNRSLV
jgi:hypothetical protein